MGSLGIDNYFCFRKYRIIFNRGEDRMVIAASNSIWDFFDTMRISTPMGFVLGALLGEARIEWRGANFIIVAVQVSVNENCA